MYYKLGQACVTNWGSFVLLQIRANVVTNWGSFIITNQGKCCYKLGQLLQIRATVSTKQGSHYKLGQNVLQIVTGITNQGNYYKLGHNSIQYNAALAIAGAMRGISKNFFLNSQSWSFCNTGAVTESCATFINY